jgi:glycosyltransferase involved in cell wall biosynthesis
VNAIASATSGSSRRLAYLVSRYPAVSHTFILREVQKLRLRGVDIATASINPPDRALEAMDAAERHEAEATYGVKADGATGALLALAGWLLRAPLRLAQTFALGWRLGGPGRPLRGLAYAVEAMMVARWLQRQQLDHLHVHFGNAAAAVGVAVKCLTGCRLSYTIHGPDEFDDVPGQCLALKMAHADEVICISQFARGQLMRITDPSHWHKFVVCRLGVDPDQFPPVDRSRHSGRRLLCVGRLTPAKGQVLLIQACARLAARGLDFQLQVVGAGPDRERIEAEVQRLGMGQRVELTGALNQAQVREAMAQADVFVLPSLAEGIPVVLMEAMSCGLPCVSTPVNGIPELIEHGRTGLLARPGDVDSLTDALASLLGDASLRLTLAGQARQQVQTHFDLDRNVDTLAGLLSRSPAPARAPQLATA